MKATLASIWNGPRRAWLVVWLGWLAFTVALFTDYVVVGVALFASALAYGVGYLNGAGVIWRLTMKRELRTMDALLEAERERVQALAPDHPERRAWSQMRTEISELMRATGIERQNG